jgi:hypothetical protein
LSAGEALIGFSCAGGVAKDRLADVSSRLKSSAIFHISTDLSEKGMGEICAVLVVIRIKRYDCIQYLFKLLD